MEGSTPRRTQLCTHAHTQLDRGRRARGEVSLLALASRGRYLDVGYAVGRHGDVVAQLVKELWRNPQRGAAKLELVGPGGGGSEGGKEGTKFISTGVGGAKNPRRWEGVEEVEKVVLEVHVVVGGDKGGIEKVGVEEENVEVAEENEGRTRKRWRQRKGRKRSGCCGEACEAVALCCLATRRNSP